MSDTRVGYGKYTTVAAGQTAAAVGAAATGIFLKRLIVVPATTSPGAVTLIDGDTSITIFPGGASSVNELRPMDVPVEANSANATTPGWKITTGANVSVIAVTG